MGLLDDIESRFTSQSVAGAAGTTQVTDTGWLVTKSFMPPDPDKCITIFETGGYAPEVRSDLNRPTFQIRVRSSRTDTDSNAYSTGRDKLQGCCDVLHGFASTTINGRYYAAIYALTDAIALGFDDEGRPLLGQNFLALRSRTT